MKLNLKFLVFFITLNIFNISYAQETSNIFTDGLIKKLKKFEASKDLLGSHKNITIKNDELVNLTLKTKKTLNNIELESLKKLGCKIISILDEYLIVQINITEIKNLEKASFIEIISLPSAYTKNEFEEDSFFNEATWNLGATKPNKNAGKGIKIAVIDSGFNIAKIPNFQSKTKSYSMRLDNDIKAQGNWKHGNAVLEIISKQAPAAEYFLLNIDENQDAIMLLQAIKHAVEVFDADIISLSVCDPHPRDFFDGTGIYAKYIKAYANQKNKIFVVSAGNNLKKHYSDYFQNNKYGYHDFKDQKLQFKLNKNQNVRVFLSWKEENFYRPNYNLDLLLTDSEGNKYYSNSKVKEAVELMDYTSEKDDTFTIDIEGKYFYQNKPLNEKVKFNLILYSDKKIQFIDNFKPNNSLDPNIPSIPEVITVSSVKSSISGSDFSSRGMGENNIEKPDFSAPSGIKTTAIEYFEGTSASVPYVTGIIADVLAKEKIKGYKNLKVYLKKISTDLGKKGWDNIFGYGLLLKK